MLFIFLCRCEGNEAIYSFYVKITSSFFLVMSFLIIIFFFRYWVITTSSPRMTTHNSFERQPSSRKQSVFFQCFNSVLRACRAVSTSRWSKWRYCRLIKTNQCYQWICKYFFQINVLKMLFLLSHLSIEFLRQLIHLVFDQTMPNLCFLLLLFVT